MQEFGPERYDLVWIHLVGSYLKVGNFTKMIELLESLPKAKSEQLFLTIMVLLAPQAFEQIRELIRQYKDLDKIVTALEKSNIAVVDEFPLPGNMDAVGMWVILKVNLLPCR